MRTYSFWVMADDMCNKQTISLGSTSRNPRLLLFVEPSRTSLGADVPPLLLFLFSSRAKLIMSTAQRPVIAASNFSILLLLDNFRRQYRFYAPTAHLHIPILPCQPLSDCCRYAIWRHNALLLSASSNSHWNWTFNLVKQLPTNSIEKCRKCPISGESIASPQINMYLQTVRHKFRP